MSALSPAAARAGRSMSPPLVVLLLSLMLGIQPLSTDLYLPALPALTQGFGAVPAQAQLTLTTLLLAFGSSQLVWGPLSDRFGRRPVLLAGVLLYAVGSAGCALAPSMAALVAWRALQGAAMGASVMGARAIVRDLFTPAEGARAMSLALTGLGVIACLAGPVGGWMADALGWRWILGLQSLFGLLLAALLALRFDETLPRERRAALHPMALAKSWATILRHPTFLAGSALACSSYAALFTFLVSSPFIFIRVLGLTRTQYGLVMFSSSAVYILSTMICRRLLPQLGLRRLVTLAGFLSVFAGTLLGGLAWAGVHGVWALLLPWWLFMVAYGVHQPCGQVTAVAPFPHAAGAASALNGFLMMVVAFGVGAWVGPRMDGTVLPFTQGAWFWSVCLALVAWTLMRRHGEPRQS